ncbi:hypothetical protein THRCLA_03516 [Thraustotheca clavata]|uniref:Telomere-associated protein Rif1 N-terminal domain-containing protein n=1 Tax=Thraustotheca clavata TaxID=74557 RepID=A0A1W0A1T1_9STRA|nr:hypothetical protein THRCLA_03516 [Thraustotheca clavata]
MNAWEQVREELGSPSTQARVDAYVRLNELLEEPDTRERLQALENVLPAVLSVISTDLERPHDDILTPLCVRTLAYFMYHEQTADRVPVVLVQQLFRVFYNTSDQTVCLLVIWSLSKQKLDEEKHGLVPRLVELFCEATGNRFQSRKVQIYALNGLHETLIKYPEKMILTLKKWCHVVAKCLESTDPSTRDAARRIFQTLSSHAPLQGEAALIVTTCLRLHGVPAMHNHVQAKRMLDAVHLWGILISLLQETLRNDEAFLNELLAVPEATLRDADSHVRLQSVRAWRRVVHLFPNSWFLRKPLVQLVMAPLLVCFTSDTFDTVVDTALDSWLYVLAKAVAQVNEYCNIESYASVRNVWTHWYEEIITKALTSLSKRPLVLSRAQIIVQQLWRVGDCDEETQKSLCQEIQPSTCSFSLSMTPVFTPSVNATPLLTDYGVVLLLLVFPDCLVDLERIGHGFCTRLLHATTCAFDTKDEKLHKIYSKVAWGTWTMLANNSTLELSLRCRLIASMLPSGAMSKALSILPKSVERSLHTEATSLLQKVEENKWLASLLLWTASTDPLNRLVSMWIVDTIKILSSQEQFTTEGIVNAIKALSTLPSVSSLLDTFRFIVNRLQTPPTLTQVYELYQEFTKQLKVDEHTASSTSTHLSSPCLLEPPPPCEDVSTLSSSVEKKQATESTKLIPVRPIDTRRPTDLLQPALASSKEPISSIFQHFPQSFRQLIAFYNIKTIGDIAAMTEAEVQDFPLKDPSSTIHKALDEFLGRQERINTLANKSPHKRKSPFNTPPRSITPHRRMQLDKYRQGDDWPVAKLTFESPRPKVAEKVTFHLASPDGSVKMARPGEDSQQFHEIQDKSSVYSTKLLSHLERCNVYVDKIHHRALEKAPTPVSLLGDLEKAHGHVTTLAGRLHATAKAIATKHGHTSNDSLESKTASSF